MIKKVLVLVIPFTMFTSCATIATKQTYIPTFFSDQQNTQVRINDSIYNLPSKINIKRSKEDLNVTLITADSIEKDFTLRHSPNPQFLFGNLLLFHAAPVGYAVDFTTEKRFYYGQYIKLSTTDTNTVVRPFPIRQTYRFTQYLKKKYPVNKGRINVVFSIPFVNGFNMQPEGEGYKSKTGFNGISAGIDYYYKDNRFINVRAAAMTDLFFFIGSLNYASEHERLSTFAISVTDNYNFGGSRYSIGYGLNYSINRWSFVSSENYDIQTRESERKTSRAFGLTANTYYQFNKYFYAGVVYHPTFYTISPEKEWLYQHVISLDIVCKLKLRKAKKIVSN